MVFGTWILAIGYLFASRNLAMRLAVEPYRHRPRSPTATLLSVKNFRLKLFSKSESFGFETAHLEERTALIEYSVGHLIINVHRTGIGDEQTGRILRASRLRDSLCVEMFLRHCRPRYSCRGRSAAGQNSDCFFHVFTLFINIRFIY